MPLAFRTPLHSAMLNRVAATIRRRRLFAAGERVAVAVSGGSDSVALAWLLHDLAPEAGWSVAGLIHVNHKLRGSEAESEGGVTDATGTIGIARSIRETPGATWILCKAAASVLWNVPYCLKHREPVKSEDFELPLR